MDEKARLIQRSDRSLSEPWYKQKRVIILVAVVCAVLACVVVVVIVVPVVIVELTNHRECAFDNAKDCVEGLQCIWCYNSDGTGKCKEPGDGPRWPVTCSGQLAFMCNAYGFATGENYDSCVSFIQPASNSTCCWMNPFGNCYHDSGYGPIGCCFSGGCDAPNM